MKKKLLILFFVSGFVVSLCSLKALRFEREEDLGDIHIKPNLPFPKERSFCDIETQRLYILCKVWGFLKYHHPDVANGNYNWDEQLFEIIPYISDDKFDSILNNWIIPTPISFELSFKNFERYKWIETTPLINQEAKNKLLIIRNKNRINIDHHYVKFSSRINRPIFTNEIAYVNNDYHNEKLQILALFRYWNMIEYFYPYKNLIGRNWDSVLVEYIPKVRSTNNSLSYRLVIQEIIKEIGDSHAQVVEHNDSVMTSYWGIKRAPIKIDFIEGKVVIVKKKHGVRSALITVGDIITEVNGVSINEIILEKAKYCVGSNASTINRNISYKLMRSNNDSVFLTLINNKRGRQYVALKNINYDNDFFRVEKKESFVELAEGFGYLYAGSLKKNDIFQIIDRLETMKGLIVDLRCYPSEFIVYNLGNYLVPEKTVFAMLKTTSIHQPGSFNSTYLAKVGGSGDLHFKGKIIVLVDNKTQSQSEFTAMAFKVAPNVTIIGSTTSGADGDVSIITLPGNVRTLISGIGVYYPNGSNAQKVGILPDISISKTIEATRNGTDRALEKAIELMGIGKLKSNYGIR